METYDCFFILLIAVCGGAILGFKRGRFFTKEGGNRQDYQNHIIPHDATFYTGLMDEMEKDAFFGVDSLISSETGNYRDATKGLIAGDAFPERFRTGDVYVFGDYEYRYNQIWSYGFGGVWISAALLYDEPIFGWGVRVLDEHKRFYGEILAEINGAPIVDLHMTFYGCRELEIAPEIPLGVKKLRYTFCECSSLKKAPRLPDGITDVYSSFYGCASLSKAPCIPKTVKTMDYMFYYCILLSGTLVVHAEPASASHCFLGTKYSIILRGNCTPETKEKLAATAANKNVSF